MGPDDVRHAVQWLGAELRARPDGDYDAPAHGLEWSCRRTLDHVLGELLSHALQLAGRARDDYLPLDAADDGPGLVRSRPSAGVAGLATNLEAMGELLATQVGSAEPTARAHHRWGESDPAGFAAMGVCEVLVHGWDVLTALDEAAATLPPDLCAEVLARLFPGSPTDLGSEQDVLLWQTGREDIGGLGRLTTWRWDATVR